MKKKHFLSLVIAVLTVAGCETSKPGPYLFREGLDGRIQDENLSKVMVCYNAKWTTPQAVRDVAAEGCGRVGLIPQFTYQDTLACPIFLPARAHFNCIKPTAPPVQNIRTAPGGSAAGGDVQEPEAPPELPAHLRPVK
ncbi:MAG: hypothetical protein OQJ99_00725 [Rhodospirillales bacterium]|nr:hypothetical protein [Rhodospirillales bacterium]MCW8951966.1 hypothetical protein [Rhodospirillales bacterium]MCW8971232.1 hypothetical protein [Rhodospirillales bacterium]MCW9039200.1 hypothetical protein [Rhodospirillales bacterium]